MLRARARVLGAIVAGLSLAAPALASEGGGGSSLIEPQIGTIFWTLVTFFALVLVLGRYAWKPLVGALEARERAIREDLEAAARRRDEAQALVAEQRELLTAARRERAEAMDAGRRDAERVKQELLDEARKQREQVLRETQAQVEAGMRKARAELRGTVVDLALRAAEKLLARNLDEATHRRLVEDHLDEIERGGRGARPS